MRVIQVVRFGGPEVLVPADLADPVAGDAEVVVDVEVADVLFLDTQLRSGWGRGYFAVSPPYVAGNGVAGTVSAVGPGVDSALVGRRVIARVGPTMNEVQVPMGGYAERAVAAVGEVVEVPDGLPLRDAVTFLHDGPTALGLLHHAALQPGERVLINAAAGGLGALLVPRAKAAGATVVAAARGARKLELVREWGADVAVDYTESGWLDEVGGVDIVFDGAGGAVGEEAFGLVAEGGRYLSYGAASGDFPRVDQADASRRGVRYLGIQELRYDGPEARRELRALMAEAAAGRFRPFVGQAFPLERAADAHAAIEARRTVGKTVLEVG
ncbi:zinc-binding dehydrogenase [Actinophytocola gossypii]|uniref:Zinc-binding dehydrogenase n=1 Tax=Actinophytocola gossypii TaxID=2812003 RepID=A0ABT2J4Z6_9PSEU|nr:zinc-binding dehydrogenase [Actinophytocola gossypii]MCT2582937.1 zinc-binding dehydrogenase [Actinophytocola gossypii]